MNPNTSLPEPRSASVAPQGIIQSTNASYTFVSHYPDDNNAVYFVDISNSVSEVKSNFATSGSKSRPAARLEFRDCVLGSKRIHEDMAKTAKKAKRTPSAAFMKPVTPNEKLAKVIGDKPLPRTELTKKLWVYIKKNGLQDAKKKTLINADENLKAVFNGKKQVSMFEMTKLVSGHLKK